MAYMLEVERRWLIPEAPLTVLDLAYKRVTRSQGYLSLDPVVRVSVTDSSAELTMKFSGEKGCHEYSYPIPVGEAWELLSHDLGRGIVKTRSYIEYNNYTIELDEFRTSELKGLWIAEVEFPNMEDAKKFVAPDWFGVEITDVPEFSNKALSMNPEFYRIYSEKFYLEQ